MPKKHEAKRTKLEYRALAEALRRALPELSTSGIVTLTGHVAHETGMRLCYNWNLGNVKSREGDGRDFVFFECGEEVPLELALEEQKKHPNLILFSGKSYLRNGKRTQSVKVLPEHPWSRFRAFDTLEEGVLDYISVLRLPRYAKAWEALEEGDLTRFSDELGKGGYFTASPAKYRTAMRREVARVRGAFLGRPTIKLGDENEHVRYWQEILGFTGDDLDGDFGKKTQAATKKWQKQRGLLDDGEVGFVTWANAHPAFEVRL